MDELALVVIIGYWVGFLLTIGVYRSRAGLGFWSGRLRIFGPTGVGVEWAATYVMKVITWPVVLGVWLAMGRPEPRIVFNEKADARRQTQPA